MRAQKAARRVAGWSGLALALAAATAIRTTDASAKASSESPYGYDRTWNAALRLVRVDNGWKITEKDEANGYLLFDYKSPENAKVTGASIEVLRGRDPDAPVGIVVQIPRMPRYHEQLLLDALSAKMRREYGDLPPSKRPDSPPEPPDGGTDGG